MNIPCVEIEDLHIDGKCVEDAVHVGGFFEIKMRNIGILILFLREDPDG